MSFSIYQVTQEWSEHAGLTTHAMDKTESTNDWAKEDAFEESEALSIYLTDHQTAGRGRGSHTWTDVPAGQSLLSSWSFLLLKNPQPVLAPSLGLALFKAASTTWLGFPWSLKAPNDLYLGDRKVAGLLLESVQEGTKRRLVVGLGVNVFAHPGVDRSGALSDQIPLGEITPEIWRQFLDRLLLEFTSSLLLAQNTLQDIERRGLLFALNLFPETRGQYKTVGEDGSLVRVDGSRVAWTDL